jgi:outer membrane protease
LSARLALAFAASVASAAPVCATDWPVRTADWSFRPAGQAATYRGDVGLRFWYGRGTTAKNLYDPSGAMLVSRLTYDGLSIYAAEAYVRFDFDRGWFLKGFAGGGGFRKGNLTDEDWGLPAPLNPYSATLSVQENGSPYYGSVDLGYSVVRGGDFRVGLFAGFHYMNETVSAFGCTQQSFNPFICGMFPVPNTVNVITQENNWYSLRLGVDAAVELGRVKLSLDAAWLPYVSLYGSDAHWLRIGNFPGDFTGKIPEDGTGWGYQVEGFVSYRVTEAASIGVGARYWRMQTKGNTHFEDHIVGGGGLPQPVEWKTESYGVFVQGSLKFGPYPVISVN